MAMDMIFAIACDKIKLKQMYKIIFLFFLQFIAFADNSKNIKYLANGGQGVEYVFIAEDISNQQLIFRFEVPFVDHNGNYCYISKETFDKHSRDFEISDSFCKPKPPLSNIIFTLNTAKNNYFFYPDDGSKPFQIPSDAPSTVFSNLDKIGIIGNQIQDIHKNFTFDKQHVSFRVFGRGVRSRGMCSDVPDFTIDLKINDTVFMKDLFFSSCNGIDIYTIVVDFKKKKLFIYIISKRACDEFNKKKKLTYPLQYFKTHTIEYFHIPSDKPDNYFQFLSTPSKTELEKMFFVY